MRCSKALWLFGIITLSFIFLLGCAMDNVGEDNGEPVAGAPAESDQEEGDSYPLKTSLEITEDNGELQFQISLINIGQEDIELLFGSGQQYEIVITDDAGDEVYRYSDGKAFTLALVMKQIAAGDQLDWTEVINIVEEGLVASEKYMVEVEVLADSEELTLNKDDLRITQVLYISSEGRSEQDSATNVTTDPANGDETTGNDTREIRDQMMDDGTDSILYDDGKSSAPTPVEEPKVYENQAFRNVTASGGKGRYMVRGEARIFEANVNYAVSDGHDYVIEGFTTASEGAPEWGKFDIQISIPPEDWPVNGTLTLELYEGSAKDGSKLHTLYIPLESFK